MRYSPQIAKRKIDSEESKVALKVDDRDRAKQECSMRKEQDYDRKANCLNFIRILAALNVFISHAIFHLNIDNSFVNLLREFFSLFMGVPIFFILSGFLIWASIGRSSSFKDYAKRRVFRIFPELWGGGIC